MVSVVTVLGDNECDPEARAEARILRRLPKPCTSLGSRAAGPAVPRRGGAGLPTTRSSRLRCTELPPCVLAAVKGGWQAAEP